MMCYKDNPWKMLHLVKKDNDVNAEHSLGKGEVHSSILCGSTTNPYKNRHSQASTPSLRDVSAQNEARNAHIHPWKIRGLCSAAVPGERAHVQCEPVCFGKR